MLDESLRRRLEALNRGPLPEQPTIPPRHSASAVQERRANVKRPLVEPRPVKPMPGLLRRGEVVSNEGGRHLRLCVALEELWPRGQELIAARYEQLRRHSKQPENNTHADFATLVRHFPERVMLLDLETCGLGGAAVFLIGLLRCIGQEFAVELLLARHYGEEKAILETFWKAVDRCEVVVSFNGKTFDWPMLVDRSQRHLLHRDAVPPQPLHVDLLHHSRRRWKAEFPDCRLQTLERLVCGRRRVGDIPGKLIPAAYADYVRTGFGRDIESVLYHNAVDLVTLMDLAMRLSD